MKIQGTWHIHDNLVENHNKYFYDIKVLSRIWRFSYFLALLIIMRIRASYQGYILLAINLNAWKKIISIYIPYM